MLSRFCIVSLATLSLVVDFVPVNAQLNEHDRLAEYHRRNYTWPLEHFVPDTPGWRELFEHRFRQIKEIEDVNQRYEGYLQNINAAFFAPNFTEHGFGLARAPDDLMEALRQGIREGVEKGPRLEPAVEVIEGLQPWFIDRPDLTKRVLNELQHYPETWAGFELTPYRAYGFRLYRDQSVLNMHIDKSQTHVISFILHIDSSDDAEPWPIVIEDFQGNTHEITLTSGDMVFYESSKVFHGRPQKLNGSWYSSVFVHYYPKYGWKDVDHDLEKHYAIPPIWSKKPRTNYEIPLQMVGTSMKEPTCPDEWCSLKNSIKWSGPGEHGVLINPDQSRVPFDPLPQGCMDHKVECEDWASWDSNECERNSPFMKVYCKKSCGVCVEDNTHTISNEL